MREIRRNARLLLAYPIIWVLSVAIFWLLMSGADAMGYAIIFVWLVNPIGIFVTSLLIGRKCGRSASERHNRMWAAPVIFGILYMLLPYATFSLANTLSSGNIHVPDAEMALFGALVSAVGLCLGLFAGWLTRRSGK